MFYDYARVSADSWEYGETNDCAVRAVSLVCGAPYSTVHNLMRSYGRKSRGATYVTTTRTVVERLGYELESIQPPAKTIRTIAGKLGFGRYLVRTRNHILAVVDGRVLDWSGGSRLRVLEVYQITG